jgi:regulation of enolase protein 1 (concanavalin A-like superfamily)
LAASSNLLAGALGSVSLLGGDQPLHWSQTATGLVVTCPSPMPILPTGTAIGFKIGPATAIGSPIPTTVLALPGTNQVSLSWSYPTTTATFTVSRSTTQGGPFAPLVTNLVGTSFSDTNVSPGALYFYKVSALDTTGPSANSSAAAAVPLGEPSNLWLTEDVGAVGAPGSFNQNGGIFTLQGSGSDIWSGADGFRYVFQALSGDCSITARVVSMQDTAPWAKAGVMIRETLDPAAQYVLNFMSPENGAALQQRNGTAAAASGVSNNPGLAVPYWLRLVRSGNAFSASVSPDGINWTALGTTTVTMNAGVYVGLAVCSVDNGTLCQAQFDNVSVSSSAFVVSSPLPSLIHRYSFNEAGGTVAVDSVGGANGTLRGGACFDGQGRVVLNGTSGTYVSLPENLLAGLPIVTLEAWVTNSVSPDNVALFSFDDGLQDGVGGGYLRLVLHDQGNGRNFLELASGAGSPMLAASPGLGGQYVHVVAVYNQTTGTALIYTNGVIEATMAVSTALSNVSPNAGALGRSPWGDDPWLNGAIDEFRIYAGALLPADIAATQIAGPDALVTTNVLLGVSQSNETLILNWPVTGSGFTLEASQTLGHGAVWTPVTNSLVPFGLSNQVPLPPSGPGLFFRLRR